MIFLMNKVIVYKQKLVNICYFNKLIFFIYICFVFYVFFYIRNVYSYFPSIITFFSCYFLFLFFFLYFQCLYFSQNLFKIMEFLRNICNLKKIWNNRIQSTESIFDVHLPCYLILFNIQQNKNKIKNKKFQI